MDEKAIIKYLKSEIEKLNTTANAFLLFSGIKSKVPKEVFYKSFDEILTRISGFVNQLKNY